MFGDLIHLALGYGSFVYTKQTSVSMKGGKCVEQLGDSMLFRFVSYFGTAIYQLGSGLRSVIDSRHSGRVSPSGTADISQHTCFRQV
jgi:hypothetical protein